MRRIINFLYIATTFSAIGCHFDMRNEVERVVLSKEELQKSYFSADILPHCIMDLSPGYSDNQCYASSNETSGDPIKILHTRLISNMDRLTSRGGEYSKLPNDNYALRHEAACTLGIKRSCALNTLLSMPGVNITADMFVSLATGQAVEFYEELESIYPEDYDPRDYEQFRNVVTKGIKILGDL